MAPPEKYNEGHLRLCWDVWASVGTSGGRLGDVWGFLLIFNMLGHTEFLIFFHPKLSAYLSFHPLKVYQPLPCRYAVSTSEKKMGRLGRFWTCFLITDPFVPLHIHTGHGGTPRGRAGEGKVRGGPRER